MTLTSKQKQVMRWVTDTPNSTQEIVVEMNRQRSASTWYGFDAVHSMLTTLERNRLVRREQGRPATWVLTEQGRKAKEEALAA